MKCDLCEKQAVMVTSQEPGHLYLCDDCFCDKYTVHGKNCACDYCGQPLPDEGFYLDKRGKFYCTRHCIEAGNGFRRI